MLPSLRLYCVTLFAFLVLDGLWLSQMVPTFYSVHMDGLMRADVIWPAALLFYLLYAAAVAVLAVAPALKEGRVWGAVWRGALLGAAAYGTYNLTNYSTLAGWPLIVTLVDQVWGTVLGAATAGGSAAILLRAGRRAAQP